MKKIEEIMDKLSPELQRRLLDFASQMLLKGTGGKSILQFQGAIPDGDLQLISKAVEETCEKVNVDEW